jgi:hypothetical protein
MKFSSQIKYADTYFHVRINGCWKLLDFSPKGEMPNWLKLCNGYEPEGSYVSGGHGNFAIFYSNKEGQKCPEIWTDEISCEDRMLILSHFKK